MKDQDPTPQALKAAQDIAEELSKHGLTGLTPEPIAAIIDQHCKLHELNAVVEAARAVHKADNGDYITRRFNSSMVALYAALDALPVLRTPQTVPNHHQRLSGA